MRPNLSEPDDAVAPLDTIGDASRRDFFRFAGLGVRIPWQAKAMAAHGNGGRALDGTPASITALPSIADEVMGELPLILDSGIRCGTDVVKALALGATAVAIGRPIMFGLAAGGASGVDSVIRYFHTETVDGALHSGVDNIAKLNREHVRHI